jgi:hypothetical protein
MTQAYNLSQLANKVNTSGQIDVSTALNGVTSVPNGGTGQSTFTDGQLLIGNTTGNTLTKATLTAGSGISVTNGNGSITIATTGGGQLSYALFSSGSGTWTCPNGVTKVKVTCIAGGGGGFYNDEITIYYGGNGGCAIGIYTVTPGSGYAYSVGSGGNGGEPNVGYGTNGTSSSVTGLCSATGGVRAQNNNVAHGAGSNGIFTNSFYSGNYMFYGSRAPGIPGVAWNTTLQPGIGGYGYNGGVGGVILIEYIG